MIRVVVAEDVRAMRELLVDLLEASSEIDVVAVADDVPTVLDRVAETLPDVVVTDVRMPPTATDEGVRVAEQLQAAYPRIGVVVLTQDPDPGLLDRVLAGSGARRGWVLKQRVNDHGQLVAAVKAVHSGATWIDPKADPYSR
jgi:DNA-binding NarL/FixJ family response regulator